MYFSDKITLRAVTITLDSYGGAIETPVDTEVWADITTAKRTEFYAAQAVGIKLSNVFTVHVEDWNNQTQVIHDSKKYNIVRSYQKGHGTVELLCEVRA